MSSSSRTNRYKELQKTKGEPRHSSRAYAPKNRSSVSFGGQLKRFFTSKWVWRLLFLGICIAILAWQWDTFVAWVKDLAIGTYGFLGWGILLILIAAITISIIIFRHQIADIIKRHKLYLWHVWLGSAVLFLAAWGIMGLFSLGGVVGQRIVGDYAVLNVLRVIGLILLGLILIAPKASWRIFKNIARWFIDLFRATPARNYTARGSGPAPYISGKTQKPPMTAQFRQEIPKVQHEGGIITGASAGTSRSAAFAFTPKPTPMSSDTRPVEPWRYAGLNTEPKEKAVSPEVDSIPAMNRFIPSAPEPAPAILNEKVPEKTETRTEEAMATPTGIARLETDNEIQKTENMAEPGVTAKIEGKETHDISPKSGFGQVAQDVWRKYGESSAVLVVDGWKLPPLDILDKAQEATFSEADNKQRASIIENALASYGVNAKVVQINVGPTVTQFGVEPGWDIKTRRIQERDEEGNITVREEEISRTRVKVERITSLANDLALALAAPTIRIEAPVPGKPIVGVEVPNKIYSTVSLRGVIESNGFQKVLAKSKLALALGKGAGGEAVSDDLAKMPHLLIAGATGSGKTVCLNAIICCILMNNTPFDTKLIMIDPKRVELTPFNSLPHLATPVIVDTSKALGTMRWLNMEMDNRYKKLAAAQARNIEGYNKNRTGADRMPNLVLVIDELADLMMAGFDEVEHILCRLAQLARAVGIHLVVATQRPSVDVITGLIKANFPTRISFAVTSQVDSRTILDMVGAEKLLGRGDMLYAPTEAAKPKRLQGCFVSDTEVERLVYFWNNQKRDDVVPIKIEDINIAPSPLRKDSPSEDPLMETVRQLASEHGQISASFLQRKLNIGYPRAARLFDHYKEEVEQGKDGGAEIPPEED